MAEDDTVEEVLAHLRGLSKNLITSEVIHEELTQFRREAREDRKDIISDLKGQAKEIDVLQIGIINLKNEFSTFKIEVEPLIQFKETIQKQVIRYTSVAFLALMATMLGINEAGLA